MLYKSYIYYILTAFFPVLSVGVSAQTMSENYVKTETVLSGNGLKSSLSVQYYDGLGRPSVLAAGGVNTENSYVYTMTEYDQGFCDHFFRIGGLRKRSGSAERRDHFKED